MEENKLSEFNEKEWTEWYYETDPKLNMLRYGACWANKPIARTMCQDLMVHGISAAYLNKNHIWQKLDSKRISIEKSQYYSVQNLSYLDGCKEYEPISLEELRKTNKTLIVLQSNKFITSFNNNFKVNINKSQFIDFFTGIRSQVSRVICGASSVDIWTGDLKELKREFYK